jgi:hypothetical protein
MHRRRLLKSSAALFVLHALTAPFSPVAGAPTFDRGRRRVRPGELGWPYAVAAHSAADVVAAVPP